jgi:hypothetical protein
VSMTLFGALSHIRALDIREVRHPHYEHFQSASGHDAFMPNGGLMASVHVRIEGPDSSAAVATISRLDRGIVVDVAKEITWWMSELPATTALGTVASVLARMPPGHLALLTVALDAAQANGPVPEYRSPVDVERIAELERLLAGQT